MDSAATVIRMPVVQDFVEWFTQPPMFLMDWAPPTPSAPLPRQEVIGRLEFDPLRGRKTRMVSPVSYQGRNAGRGYFTSRKTLNTRQCLSCRSFFYLDSTDTKHVDNSADCPTLRSGRPQRTLPPRPLAPPPNCLHPTR